YLLDSNESKAFSFPLTNDEEFDYSIREEFVSRVPEVFERAVNSPAGWSPDSSQYYRVYADEREEVANEILSGKDRMDLYYVECYIPYSDRGQDKLEKWNEAWEAAWDMYKEQW
ncbi:MAG: hypothetical protein IJU93_03035, partial [Lachnospiraceae bacterium]|nr:hypothetical protein [Lachnospiraceae bacterium]